MSPARERRDTGYSNVDVSAYLSSIGYVRQAQADEIVAFAGQHGATGEWLDVGCGFGYVLNAAQFAGFRVRGIEPDDIARAAATGRGINVSRDPLNDATPPADIVSTLDVLEHLSDINAFANLMKVKAKKYWLIKVPSSDGTFYRLSHVLRIRGVVERLWQTHYEHPHLTYFNELTLRHFLGKHGFKIVAVRYLQETPARSFRV